MKKMLAYAGIALLFLAACQKNNDTGAVKETEKLTASSAKEWYHGTFKKGTEWQQSAQKGKKLPDWKNGIASQFGSYEVVDFPLLKQKFAVPVIANQSLTEENKKRVADAAVHRIAFFKDKKGNIAVRQLTFIPDFDYLRQKDFDISNNTFGNIDDNYSGLLIVQQWNEEYVAVSRIKNGKVTNRYKVANIGTFTEAEGGCNGTLVIEYERYCEVTISSDGIVTEECGAWMPTGNQWCFEDDPGGGDPCADPESPQCACAGYGLCDTGGGGDDGEACRQKAEEIFASGTVLAEKESTNDCGISGNTRYKCYTWKIYTVSDGLIPMYLKSRDKAVQTKGTDSRWRFQSLTHESIEKSGTEIGYTVSLEGVSPTATISSHLGVTSQVANMHLSFTVKMTAICQGFPITNSVPKTTEMAWHVSE